MLAVKPDQCTLVPVKPGEITSEAGWPADTPADALAGIVGALKAAGVRVSLFVDPEPAAIRWAKTMGADRVELYTEPFARAFERGPDAAAASFAKYAAAANLAHELGVGVNAGHDLDLKNLTLFRTLPHLDEVSIGHALVSRAIFVGLGTRREGIPRGAVGGRCSRCCSSAPSAEARRARRVTLAVADGVTHRRRVSTKRRRARAPAVLLVHMLSRNKGDWGGLPDRIREAGITALDDRSARPRPVVGLGAGLQAMVQDVRAAAQWLATRPNVRGEQIAIVGASLGASLALLAAVDLPQVRAIGLLSPSLDYRGLRTDIGLVKRLGARSIWLAASAEDPLALRTLRDIAAEPSGPREQHVSSARRPRHRAARARRRRGARAGGLAAPLVAILSIPMRADAIVFGIAGALFGLIIGWVLGSQQAAGAARVAAPVAQAAPAQQPAGGRRRPAPIDPGARQGARGRRGAESQGRAAARAARQHVLRRRAVSAGDHVVRAGARAQSAATPTCRRISAWRTTTRTSPIARWRSSIKSLAIDPKHIKTLLNVGIVRAFGKQDLAGAGKAWQQVVDLAPDSPEGQAAKKGLEGIKSAQPDRRRASRTPMARFLLLLALFVGDRQDVLAIHRRDRARRDAVRRRRAARARGGTRRRR